MIIATLTNNDGKEIVIHNIRPEVSPKAVTSFFLAKWAELVESGHASGSYFPTINPLKGRILYATVDGQMAGHIVYEWTTPVECFIVLTAVDQQFRGQGLYKTMHHYYDNLIISQGAKRSKSQLHVNNATIIAAAEQDGYRKEYYRMIKEF